MALIDQIISQLSYKWSLILGEELPIELPRHSRLGGPGAVRWVNSVVLKPGGLPGINCRQKHIAEYYLRIVIDVTVGKASISHKQ